MTTDSPDTPPDGGEPASVSLEVSGEAWTVTVLGRARGGPAAAPTPLLLLGFSHEGEDATVGRLIRNRRLDKCHQELQNPAFAEKPISQIAYSWGFNNPSHFSRIFKERFGKSPQAMREAVPE